MTLITSNTVTETIQAQQGSYTCYTAKCSPLLGQQVCVPRMITQTTPCDGVSSYNTAAEACANAGCAIS